MAELRVTSTGTIKLFESDDTSSVTIASPASLGGDRTITLPDANVDLTEVNTMPIANLDIDGGTDIGAAITDSDLFIIDDGAGGTNRKTTASRIKTYVGGVSLANDANNRVVTGDGSGGLNGEANLTFDGNGLVVAGTAPSITIGDAGEEDTKIVFDGNAQDFHIGLDDSADSLTIGLGSTLGTTSHMVIDATGAVTKPLQPAFLVKTGSTQSNYATATTHTVQFANEVFDNNADYNTGTYTFTAPVTGRYQLSCGLKINNIDKDSDYYQGQIVVSNNSIDIFNIRTAQVFNEDSTYYRWTVSMLVDMDANDTAYVTFRPQAGDATADINVNESLFSGFLVC